MEDKKVKIATCQTCHWPIHQDDLIYRSSTSDHEGNTYNTHISKDISIGNYDGSSETEHHIQCGWCMEEYETEVFKQKLESEELWKKNKKYFRLPYFLLAIILLLFFILEIGRGRIPYEDMLLSIGGGFVVFFFYLSYRINSLSFYNSSNS